MKKTALIVVLVLLLSVLAPGAALAETVPAGLSWDVSEEQVLALIGKTGLTPLRVKVGDSDLSFYHFDAAFGGYPLDCGLLCLDGHPVIGEVTVTGQDGAGIVEKAVALLSSRLGEPNSQNYDLVIEIASATGGTLEDPDGFAAAEKYLWELADGRTVVFTADIGGAGLMVLDRGILS